MRYQRSQLRLAPDGAAGSEGVVRRVLQPVAADLPARLVYKELNATTPGSEAALERQIRFRAQLAPATRHTLDQIIVWPLALVEDQGRVTGFLMAEAPDTYYCFLRTSQGPERVLRELQHLATSAAIARTTMGHDSTPTPRQRLELARCLAYALDVLHGLGTVYGDLSWKNGLYTLDPSPAVLLLEGDGVRQVGQVAGTRQLHSRTWEPPEGGPQTVATDRHKLGLMILRILTPERNAQHRDPEATRGPLDEEGIRLLRLALGADPTARPTARQWFDHLTRRIAAMPAASTPGRATPPPPPPAPTPPPPPPPGGPRTRANRRVAAVAAVLTFLILGTAGAISWGRSSTVGAVTAPAPTPSPTASTTAPTAPSPWSGAGAPRPTPVGQACPGHLGEPPTTLVNRYMTPTWHVIACEGDTGTYLHVERRDDPGTSYELAAEHTPEGWTGRDDGGETRVLADHIEVRSSAGELISSEATVLRCPEPAGEHRCPTASPTSPVI